MDALNYVIERDLPPMTSEWGYRETLRNSNIAQPIILISTNVKMSGYADLVYELIDLPDVVLNLKVNSEGWSIEPIIQKIPSTRSLVACPYHDDNSLYKRLQRTKGMEMEALWKLGFPILLKVTDTFDTGFLGTRPGILFSINGKISVLAPGITEHLIGKLFKEAAPKFETLEVLSKRNVRTL